MLIAATPRARFKKMLFSFSRVSCIEYMGLISVWSAVMCGVLLEAVFLITLPSMIAASDVTRHVTDMLTYIVLSSGSVVVMVNFILIAIRRLHDCGYSAWWWLVSLIPGIGFILGIMLLVVPGSKNENRFGLAPQKANWFNYILLLAGPIAFSVLFFLLRSLII